VGRAGFTVVPITVDVRNPGSVNSLFKELRPRSGRLYMLFNNAGTRTSPKLGS
jgi:NAD(P)-dependent dehydrogenase (short-subunit alcohol dehydrogenase family)